MMQAALFTDLPTMPKPSERKLELVTEKSVLSNSGREANHDLGFRRWSASKKAQYFTPVDFARTLCDLAAPWLNGKKAVVLDPTCGTGRLLHPWKKAGHHILGVELDQQAATQARHLLGAASVGCGDLLGYIPHLKDKANIVVTNPPFGLFWNIEGKENLFHYSTVRDDDTTLPSELAAIDAAFSALDTGYRRSGLILAILPVHYATSPRHLERIRRMDHERLIFDIDVANLFKPEYGISVPVRLQAIHVSQNHGYHRAETITGEINYSEKSWKADLAGLWGKIWTDDNMLPFDEVNTPPRLPDLSRLDAIKVDYSVSLTTRGPVASPAAAALLDFLDETYQEYDPVRGIQGGAISAVASKIALLHSGPKRAAAYLADIGFAVTPPNERDMTRLLALRKKFQDRAAPIMPVAPQDRLAYFLDRPYVAQQTMTDESGAVLWEKGTAYHFRPGWETEDKVTKTEMVGEKKDRHAESTHIEARYFLIRVQAETGPVVIDERDHEAVRRLIRTFGLPAARSVEEVFPERIKAYRNRLSAVAPFLFDYQAEDVARLACKPTGYLGYEMGGGKTIASAAWASLRQYRRVLVVCESGLVPNWLAELKNFGFKISELRSHSAVGDLRARIAAEKKSPDKSHDTEFFVTSYEFLSLGDRAYDPWTCHREMQDQPPHHIEGNTSHACRECGRDFLTLHPVCPKCQNREGWSGFCRKCGYRAFTYGKGRERTAKTSFPAIRYVRKLFGCVLCDEAQTIKSKGSLRGQAVRSIRADGKLVLTGTLLKGFVTDLYWTVGWLYGHDTPLFPYPWRAGSRRFLDEFATYERVDKEFADSLSKGRAKLIPEVSNLSRFRRLIAPMTVRRLKSDMPELKALPEKFRHVETLIMHQDHADLYDSVSSNAVEEIRREFINAGRNSREVNMGVISRQLWRMRFAATVPTARDHIPGALPEGTDTAVLTRIREIMAEAKAADDKVLIFSGLQDMQDAIAADLKTYGITSILADAQSKKRHALIKAFEADPEKTAIVTGLEILNRGFTITKANRVIITDIRYTPEPHRQAEDRVHRPGQTKEVHIHYLFSRGTIQEVMYAVTEAKQRAIDAAIDGKIGTDTARVLRECAGNVALAVAKRLVDSLSPS